MSAWYARVLAPATTAPAVGSVLAVRAEQRRVAGRTARLPIPAGAGDRPDRPAWRLGGWVRHPCDRPRRGVAPLPAGRSPRTIGRGARSPGQLRPRPPWRPCAGFGGCALGGPGGSAVRGDELRHDRPDLCAAPVGRAPRRLPRIVRRRVLGQRPMRRLVPLALVLAPAAATLMWVPLGSAAGWPIVPLLVIEYVGLAILAIALHGRLAADRPPADQLTDFYLTMSTGGVIGGAFVAVVAPIAFDGVWEYPLLVVGALAALALPIGGRQPGEPGRRAASDRRACSPALQPASVRMSWSRSALLAVMAADRCPRVRGGVRWLSSAVSCCSSAAFGWFFVAATAVVLVLATFVLPQAAVLPRSELLRGGRGPARSRGDDAPARHDRPRRPVAGPRHGRPIRRRTTHEAARSATCSLSTRRRTRLAARSASSGSARARLRRTPAPAIGMVFYEIDPLVAAVAATLATSLPRPGARRCQPPDRRRAPAARARGRRRRSTS